jgi:two-component system CheB/CheR fusion protein
MAEKVLNLIATDLNRSIAHINPNLDCPNLPELIIECMDTVTPLEHDVRDREGRWYSLRIRPYKNLDNKIDGAVLALFDVDVLKRSEQRTQRAQQFADGLIDGSDRAQALVDGDFRFQRVNRQFADTFGRTPDQMSGLTMDNISELSAAMASWQPDGDGASGPLPRITVTAGSPPRTVALDARPVPAPDSRDKTWLVVSVRETAEDRA